MSTAFTKRTIPFSLRFCRLFRWQHYELDLFIWKGHEALNICRTVLGWSHACEPAPNGSDAFVRISNPTFTIQPSGKKRRTRMIGQMHVSMDRSDPHTITHECFHILMEVARRSRKSPHNHRGKDQAIVEEGFAYGLEHLSKKVLSEIGKNTPN